jgi:hypothetical protein
MDQTSLLHGDCRCLKIIGTLLGDMDCWLNAWCKITVHLAIK